MTVDDGLKRLRWAVADHDLPIVPKKDVSFSLSFEDTEAGRVALRTFELALKRENPITFSQEQLSTLERPPWHQRVYGEITQVKLSPWK